MSTQFDPRAYAAEVEAAAEAGGWAIRHLSPCAAGPRPWLQRTSPKGPGAPHIYISAGIHGDEIAGPIAVLEMLRHQEFFADFDATIFPILNPNGLAARLRENSDGIDLNRDYRETKSDEIASHIETLKTLGRFDAAMMLHEDFEGIGAYLYELNDDPNSTLGADVITAMGEHVPIDMRPEIEDFPARGGVIHRRDITLKHGPIEQRPQWPEAIYLSINHTKLGFTTESPMPFPLEQRVKAQIAAVETVLDAVLKTETK